MTTRRLLMGALAALPATAAFAQNRPAWPDRTLRWVVGYPPGGGSDVLARLAGAALSTRLGQPVVIENRPGAATNIAAEAVAKSLPDGNTLFSADNGTLVFNQALFRRLPYDAERDFRPVGLMARFPLLVAVGERAPWATMAALVERARAAPGSIDYASPGIGSPHHLAMERIGKEAGLRFNHVPYRGMAPALNDLLAGNVPAMLLDYPSGAEHLRAGRVRALAVLSPQPLEELAAVPTVESALGLRGFEAFAWQGMVVPKAVPDEVAARLTRELAGAMQEEGVRGRMRQLGLEPLAGGPAEFEALLVRERGIWVPLIRELGITLDG